MSDWLLINDLGRLRDKYKKQLSSAQYRRDHPNNNPFTDAPLTSLFTGASVIMIEERIQMLNKLIKQVESNKTS